MNLSSDSYIFWQLGFIKLNLTIVTTWVLMVLMTIGSWLVTKKLCRPDKNLAQIPRWQNLLEILVAWINNQIEDTARQNPRPLLPLIATIILFVGLSNILAIIPGYQPPTGSLSTSTALALIVFVSVPWFGIHRTGLVAYLKNYIQPSLFMLPFNILGELSRTLALAVRLFGNIMSGSMIGAILLLIMPLFVPILMQMLGLLTGLIQAYIFGILATVYIAAGMQAQD